jgi:PAS domain-containing protein
MFLPFFLVGWLGKDAGWRRGVAPIVLLVAAFPIVMSLNRGLWASLALGIVYYVVRLVVTGKLVATVGAVVCVAVAATLFLVSPLGELSVSRLENPHSNDRRGQLLTDTVVSTAIGSPVLGFGSTRDVQGSFASIAGGGTPECPGCEVPPLGTQGQLWLVIFAQGFIGAAAFLLFFGTQLARHWRSRTTIEAVGVCLLLFFFLQLFVYDTLDLPTYSVMIGIGLMERERRIGAGAPTLESLLSTLWRYRLTLVSLVAVGAVAGAAVAFTRPPVFAATSSVLLAPAPVYLDPDEDADPKPITVDTEASMVFSEAAVQQVVEAMDLASARELRDAVRVTAPTNTRVLDITVRDRNRERAVEAADRLAAAYLEVRAEYLEQRRDQLRQQLNRLLDSTTGSGEVVDDDGVPVLAEEQLRTQLADLALVSTEAGEVLRPADARRVRSQSEVPIASGAMLGLLAGFFVVSWRESGRRRTPAEAAEVPAARATVPS